MEQTTITRIIWQHSEVLPDETMDFLRGIEADYGKVKNYVYARYSGIRNVGRLTPVYDILTEMRHCGLRTQLNLPVVYYELAVADAVTDIKSMWGSLKNKIRELIRANENLSEDDRMYIRTVLKLNSVFAAVLNRQCYEMPDNSKGLDLDVERLNNLIRRLVRRYLSAPEVHKHYGFRVTPAGYKYQDGGIYLVSRTKRQRVFLPLRDDKTADRQIQIHLHEKSVAIAIPLEKKINIHPDYQGNVYVHIGYRDLFTLSNGHRYGEDFYQLADPETERLCHKNAERMKHYQIYQKNLKTGDKQKASNIVENNLGKKKYHDQKQREWEKTCNYINAEINRMLETERPEKIVITKYIYKGRKRYRDKSVNRRLTRSFRGYIRERLIYKCRVNGIALIEISSKGTGSICSACGEKGERQGQEFICKGCGFHAPIALNSARNIETLYKVNHAGTGNK